MTAPTTATPTPAPGGNPGPVRRRPLPALIFIAALTLLTAIVWFRVLHRTDSGSDGKGGAASSCPTASAPATKPKVLPVARKVSVLVLNSTQRTGLARGAKKLLVQRHFKVTGATDDSPAYGGRGLVKAVAEIRYGSRSLAAATLLRYYFPGAKLRATDSSSGVVTVALGAKYRTLAKQSTITKQLKRNKITLTAKPIKPATTAPTDC